MIVNIALALIGLSCIAALGVRVVQDNMSAHATIAALQAAREVDVTIYAEQLAQVTAREKALRALADVVRGNVERKRAALAAEEAPPMFGARP